MKIHCECGKMISDNTDYLPYKAHLIPDENWFDVFDTIDKIIEDVAAKRITTDDAAMAVRMAHISRLMWQCTQCGRLFIDDQHQNVNIYAPTAPTDSKTILKGRCNAA